MKENNTIKKNIYGSNKYTILQDPELTADNSIICGYKDLISLGNLLKWNKIDLETLEHDIHITAYALCIYNDARKAADISELTKLFIFLKDYTNDIMDDTNESCIKLCIKIKDKIESFLKENYLKIFD